MASFEQFKKELDKLQSQGYPPHQELETLVEKYTQQADEAERILREKQAVETNHRNSQKNKSTI